jgi:hypothetical protein
MAPRKLSRLPCLVCLQEMGFIQQLSPYHYRVEEGFVPGMRVPGVFYVNDRLKGLLLEELQAFCQRGEHGGFLPAVKQIANVAALPGIVKVGWQGRAGRRRMGGAASPAILTAAVGCPCCRSPLPCQTCTADMVSAAGDSRGVEDGEDSARLALCREHPRFTSCPSRA